MVAAVTAGAPTARRAVPIRHVAAVLVGNALEFYDFLVYVYFAVYISKAFFPEQDATAGLILTYGVSFIGFLTRPIGAMIIGPMGDRIGRKPAMLLSFSLMGLAIVGLALTPSYGQIGVAAPILVLLFRAVQGFALGGEVGPTTAYLIEAASPERRGFYTALQYVTQDCGVLLAGLMGTVLASLLSESQLVDWGWRVAMMFGALIVPFGLWVRRGLPETLHAADDAALAPDATTGSLKTKTPLRPYIALIVFGLMMLSSGTIGSYTSSYTTTYAINTLHMAATVAFGAAVVSGSFSIVFEVLSGILSDRFGRKPVMLIPGFTLLASILPAFWIINTYRTTFTFYAAVAWLNLLAGLSATPVIVTLTESLPRSIRSGAVAIVYAFAISIFGGSTQMVVTALIRWTGDPLMPAYYWTGALVIGLTAMALVRESAPVKTR